MRIKRHGYVMGHEPETRMAEQMFHIVPSAGGEVVHTQHLAAFREQQFAQMTAEEAGSPSHKNALPCAVTMHTRALMFQRPKAR